MKQSHHALIWVTTDFFLGLDQVKKCLSAILEIGTIEAISSIYKSSRESSRPGQNFELTAVVRIITEKDSATLLTFTQRMNSDLTLLAVDKEVRLVPDQNLPHPSLHANRLVLRCASEAWAHYQHPVLGQKLVDLLKSSEGKEDSEFFAQGLSLLPSEFK